jgi:hypothetical protein
MPACSKADRIRIMVETGNPGPIELVRSEPHVGPPLRPASARFGRRGYYLACFGRWRLRNRTLGPPPFSSMNSTLANSKVRRTARSLAAVKHHRADRRNFQRVSVFSASQVLIKD